MAARQRPPHHVPGRGLGAAGLALRVVALGLGAHVAGALRQRTGASGAAGTAKWRSCATEGAAIANAGLVRFGFGMAWVEADMPSGASCSVASFGRDPAPNIRKACECSLEPGATSQRRVELGIEWSRCATEGHGCDCPSGVARFGSGVRWAVSAFQGAPPTLPCSADVFSGLDPAEGVVKECWCAVAGRQARPARVGIVLLSRKPPDLNMWLAYHLQYAGVEHVFMQVEDTPGWASLWNTLPLVLRQRVTVWYGEASRPGQDQRPADDYESLQARQVRAMARAKAASAAMGLQWLLHIDDDELLYMPSHRPVGDILASLPLGFDQAYIPNVEAVYESADVRSCFSDTARVNTNPGTFVSYANGKAAIRVADDAVPAGPHMWRSSRGTEPASIHLENEPFGSPMYVVHFESCPLTRWEDKFWELGNTSPQKVSNIPFRFYRDSITRMQHCRGQIASGTSRSPECTEAAMRQLWAQWKTVSNPYLRRQDLMPIDIPWDVVLGVPTADSIQ
mmetsp:Transcript_85861/g.278099  ORF Transcript_85861/g.278099 Transcript_85861/m.278099 type:complete len:509 (-) Transcript_85861:159-1685(-)